VRGTEKKLQVARWTSAILALAVWVICHILKPEGGWAVLGFFGFLIFGAPGALLTLHLIELKKKSKANDA
jgi:hypothetical protein